MEKTTQQKAITLQDAAKLKQDIVKRKKEKSLTSKAESKHQEKISELERFITLENIDIPTFFNLSGPMALYMFLRMNVNRKSDETWGNLGRYYREGFLATLRTENWIAKKYYFNQSTVGKWFKKLEAEGFIKEVGREVLKIGDSFQDHPIYALGEIVTLDNRNYEVWYYELLERKKPAKRKKKAQKTEF
jgi:hypothetical protein